MPLESTETMSYAAMLLIGAALYGSSFVFERRLLSGNAVVEESADGRSRAFRKMRFDVSWLQFFLEHTLKLEIGNMVFFRSIADLHGRFRRFGVPTPDLDLQSRKFLLDWTLFLATVLPYVKAGDIEGAKSVMKRSESDN